MCAVSLRHSYNVQRCFFFFLLYLYLLLKKIKKEIIYIDSAQGDYEEKNFGILKRMIEGECSRSLHSYLVHL